MLTYTCEYFHCRVHWFIAIAKYLVKTCKPVVQDSTIVQTKYYQLHCLIVVI